MQIKFKILLFLLVAGTVTHAQKVQQYKQVSSNKIAINSTSSAKLLQQIKKGDAYLFDVRTPAEYNAGHLQYAQNLSIQSADFGGQVKRLDKNKFIYLYSHSGNRSGKATDSLLTLGYKKTYNIGGLDSLEKAGFTIVK